MSSTGMGNTLGTLPTGWTGLPLKRWVAVRITDGPHETPTFIDDGVPFISAEAMQDGRINFDAKRGFIARESHEQYCRKLRPQRDDVFICKSGATTGKTAIVETDVEFSVWSPLALVRTDRSTMLPRFIYFALQADYLQDQVRTTWTHGTQPNISMGAIERLYVVAPDVRRQAQLVRLIDSRIAKIDALIAKKERLIELLQEKRTALISHVVTKGLDPKVTMRDSGVEWLGKIPTHWEVKRLKFLAQVRSGVAKGRDLGDKATVELPYLRVANVQNGFLDLSDVATIAVGQDECERFSLESGDVLMTEGGDYDKLGRGMVWEGQVKPCLHQNHIFAVRPHKGTDPFWVSMATVAAYARHYFILKSVQSTNLASVSATNIRDFLVPVPPDDEQTRILQHITTETAKLDALIAKVREAIDRLREYRTALISAAVTGKIDVREETA